MTRPLRVLVTGARGQVGCDLVDTLKARLAPGADAQLVPLGGPIVPGEFEVVSCTRDEFDVTDRDQVFRALDDAQPSVVVNLAAYTAVDRAEDDEEACIAVNDLAVGYLSEASHRAGAHFVTVSTDYVFDGEKGNYAEDDVANPLGVYGRSKYAGEQRCRPEDTIVRTSWVMGVRGSSVVHAMAARATSGDMVRFVTDQRGTVTAAADLSVALASFVRTREPGVWHVANAGRATWFDVAVSVGDYYGRRDFVTPIATSELNPSPRARRPANSALDTTKYSSTFGPLPQWRAAVHRLLEGREQRMAS